LGLGLKSIFMKPFRPKKTYSNMSLKFGFGVPLNLRVYPEILRCILICRVARLGFFRPLGGCLLWAFSLKITKVA
jgi:hypothetical protein